MKTTTQIVLMGIALFIFQNISFAQIQSGSFEFEGRTRDYIVFLPQNYHSNMPVVITLHGYTENATKFIEYTDMNSVADTAGFIAVYPNAVYPGFNDGGTYLGGDVNDVGFISALIDTLESHYGIDLARVYSCGYSQGGTMTYRLLNQLGHRFAAGASAAGVLNDYIASGSNPIRPFPVLHFHGTTDDWVPYNGGHSTYPDYWSVEETLNFWIENNTCMQEPDTIYLPDTVLADNSTVEKISYLNCANETSILFYKVIDGGHHWPGAVEDWGGGNLNEDIYANVELWNFFKNYENPLTNMAYSKSLEMYPFYIQSPSDTLTVKASVNNPENHPINVFAVIQGYQSSYLDTLQLFDDGLHGDGESSDYLWANLKLVSGLPEDSYIVDLITYDSIYDIQLNFHTPARFITYGPVSYEDYSYYTNDTIPNPGDQIKIGIALKNNSSVATASNVEANLISLDTLVTTPVYSRSFEDIPAGESRKSDRYFTITVNKDCPVEKEVPIVVNISIDDQIYWRDTLTFFIHDSAHTKIIKDIRTAMVWIYPIPTNSLLTIEIDQPDHHSIEIASLNGHLIYRTEMEGASTQIDLTPFSKGIYFITVRSKDYVRTEKIIKL